MRFIFYLPEHTNNSNGIKLLWDYAYYFSKKNETIVIEFDNGGKKTPYKNRGELKIIPFRFAEQDETIVYPDIVSGDPLKSHFSVRLLMAKPGMYSQGQFDIDNENSLLIAYSKAVSQVLPTCTILDKSLRDLNRIRKPKKNKVTIYYGKCRPGEGNSIKKILTLFDEVEIITRQVPCDNNSLYDAIAESRLLITFDPLTQLIFEANLLGTAVFLADDIFAEVFNDFDHAIPGILDNYSQIKYSCFDDGYLNILRDKSNHALEENLKNINFNIDKIISLIKHWRLNKTHGSRKLQDAFLEENYLFLKKWGTKPLLIANKFNGVLAYYGISNFPFFYLSLRYIFSQITVMYRMFVNFPWNIFRKSLNALHLTERDFIIYYLRKKRFDLSPPILKSDPLYSVEPKMVTTSLRYTSSSGLKFKIWSFICT